MKKQKNKKKSGKKTNQKKSNFVTFLPINKAASAALYYGFIPAKDIQVTKDDVKKASALKESWMKNASGMPWLFSQAFIEERVALLRDHAEKNMMSLPQPVMLVHQTDIIKERAKATINLEIIGAKTSIAEALLIKASVSILRDNGYKDFVIEINSIGDKESVNKFAKELAAYYKKNLNSLSAHCRQNFKKDAFYPLHCAECDPENKLKDAAPTSISCLSDASRIHFKEVLEYIETMGIPYKIKNNLVPDRKYCSGTVFEIKEVGSDGNIGDTLAVGFRYDEISQKIGQKKDNPAVGMKIFLKKKGADKTITKLVKPVAFYIQLGEEAKHKSLEIIEMLKAEKIFIYHMLGRDKFASQFALAERSKAPYVIIMGKKEFIENSVMVRENITRTQETVPIERLVEHMLSLHKKF